jgi:hypothetical protein
MYLSLDRIDVELEPSDGRARFIQTDHRTAAEMAKRPGLSAVATAIRCLNPRRVYDDAEIFYNFKHEPPAFLREIVSSCAARLWIGNDVSVLATHNEAPPIDERSVNRIFNNSMDELTSELLRLLASPRSVDALMALERSLLQHGFPVEERQSDFWSTILELGTLAGAALRDAIGGSWFYDPRSLGSLPFNYRCTFEGEPATANPLGKAIKFVRMMGDGENPSGLVQMLCSRAQE